MNLILDTFGTSLVKKDEMFVVLHKDGKQQIATHQVRTISLSKGARISSDAILMAIENEIDILFVNSYGHPQGRVWSQRYGSIANIRKNQVFFGRSPQAVSWMKEIIIRKLDNQTALVCTLLTGDNEQKRIKTECISQLEKIKAKLEELEADILAKIGDTIRGLEGSASRYYFKCLASLLPEKYRFEKRSQHPAKDMFNSLLNYAYGMLYAKVEGALIRTGIDPYLGIFHRNEYNRPVMVYDCIEPYRVWAEQVVVNLCLQLVMEKEFFSINERGDYWLASEGKRILIQSMNDYLEEVVGINGKSRSRNVHLELDCQALAQRFKNAGPA
ncbi:CRISPR-associated endonuclease Cas1 [Catalinimonas sp. 4WD22]|uniref:CRISPR-associated endonuclease Cas1 n=1 Tax=Catalinimonas locisalis TaxID=3133978 RepID=UPI0031016612